MPRSVLIFGNPGAGKSTFLNVLLGGPRFRSGLGRGGGVTQELARVEQDGVAYFDVPGLSDPDPAMRRGAAEAITAALRQAGDECSVFFVLTLEAGRIKPDDVVTIWAVLLASPDVQNYGVIINKLSPPALREVEGSPQTWMDMAMEIIPPTRRTTNFYYQKLVPAFEDEEGSRVDFGAHMADFAGLRRFIETGVPLCSIRPGDVMPVDPASFDQLRASYEALKQEAAELVQALKEKEAEARAAQRRAEASEQERARRVEEARQKEAALRASEEARRRDAREAEERLRRAREENARREESARREREANAWREREALADGVWRAFAILCRVAGGGDPPR